MPEEKQQNKQSDKQSETTVNYDLKTGEKARLVHHTPTLHIRIPINPNLAQSKDDKFKLTSSDGKYEKVMTIKDDRVDGDEFVDLIYENLKKSQKYTLEVDPGAEGSPYKLFEDVPYQELVDYYSILEEDDELENDEEKEDEDSEDDWDWEDEEDGGSEHGGDYDEDDDAMNKLFNERDQEEDSDDDDRRDEWDDSSLVHEILDAIEGKSKQSDTQSDDE